MITVDLWGFDLGIFWGMGVLTFLWCEILVSCAWLGGKVWLLIG
jgi:hypothetical protein